MGKIIGGDDDVPITLTDSERELLKHQLETYKNQVSDCEELARANLGIFNPNSPTSKFEVPAASEITPSNTVPKLKK